MFSPTKNTSFQSHTPREFWEVQKSRREIPAHRLTSDTLKKVQFSSVHFSCSFVSDSLRPHESQHTRPPCPSPTPRVHLNSRPSSQWCHPAISSVVPFSSCPYRQLIILLQSLMIQLPSKHLLKGENPWAVRVLCLRGNLSDQET